MSRSNSVFYKLVTDENSTTQLLHNLLQFDEFRVSFLQLILPDIDLSKAEWDHIRTQIRYLNSSQPDIRIRNERVFALIEVKVTADRDCADQPSRYFELLREQNEPIRRLVFLVPSNWFKRDKLMQDFQELQSVGSDVGTSVVTWNQVMKKMIDEHSHAFDQVKPFVEEFHKQLDEMMGHRPMDFESEELEMLGQVVGSIKSKAKGFDVRRARVTSSSKYYAQYGYLDGLYFRNFQGKDAFWFGVWGFFWKRRGYRLCFAVEEGWGKEVYEAFCMTYKESPIPFSRSTVGVIDNQVLGRLDAVTEIWSILEPMVKATVAVKQ